LKGNPLRRERARGLDDNEVTYLAVPFTRFCVSPCVRFSGRCISSCIVMVRVWIVADRFGDEEGMVNVFRKGAEEDDGVVEMIIIMLSHI